MAVFQGFRVMGFDVHVKVPVRVRQWVQGLGLRKLLEGIP